MKKFPELKTLLDFIRFATSSFNQSVLYFGHGTERAWDEAVTLVFHVLHLPHDSDPILLNARLVQEEKEKLLEMIQKRIEKRIPLPYLINEAWFAGLSFYVDERVLIPRSPIAELIEKQFSPWVKADQVHTILDLCTGSGCIAIACAKTFPDAKVDASDVSPLALAVAKTNILRHNVEDQVQLIESNLFSKLPQKNYDLIISNPPYVDEEEILTLPLEYQHEPSLGLAAGSKGLAYVLPILQRAIDFLSPQGILIVEVGNSEYALAERFPELPFTWLEFERGGGGVFLLTAEQLKTYQYLFSD